MRGCGVTVLVTAALAAGACGGGRAEPVRAQEPIRAVAVVGDDGMPASCRPGAIAETLRSLFMAAAARDVDAVEELLAPASRFGWYSLTVAKRKRTTAHHVARAPGAAARLLGQRGGKGERVELLGLGMGYEKRRKIANLDRIVFRYRADDVADGRPRFGTAKAVVRCADRRLVVWSGAVELGAKAPIPQTCGRSAQELLRDSRLVVCGAER